ncbi:serine/threonine protein kinase [Embleya sp. NPDC020630]|uniref:serine/threonine protein kinase n=1 Tax=Embleya sp. NPDC020630 TaxID=3363979 RepID=UPI0037901D74
MDTVIVQLPDPDPGIEGHVSDRPAVLRLGPGQSADFGRGAPDAPVSIVLPDPGVSRRAGELVAAEDYWRLSNFSRTVTYVVENLEGAGEYLKIAPGRLGAPVPFEFSRLVLPVADGDVSFKVFAPQHAYLDRDSQPRGGELTTSPFALDPTSKYFLVLLALCEPRLRGALDAATPGAGEVLERLRPLAGHADLTRSAINYHIDYLASTKLRLREATGDEAGRTGHKRERLVALALRFDLVREEHLTLLPPRGR